MRKMTVAISGTSRVSAALALALSLAALTLATGCEDEAATAATGPADATYTVRGRIAGVIGEEVSIQHEAIPSFQNREGETVGMMTMTMPFHLGDAALMEGIDTGDDVEFTFEMRWEAEHRMTITAMQKLPEGTELTL